MVRRTTGLLALAGAMALTTSCLSMTTRSLTPDRPLDPDVRITDLVTTYGNTVVFSRHDPGRVEGDRIKGTAVSGIEVRVPAPPSSVHRDPHGRIFEVVDRDGRVHSVYRVLREGQTEWIVVPSGSGSGRIDIPLSEVKQVWYRTTNVSGTFLFIPVAVVVGLTALLFAIFGPNIMH
jgi:hypothetical protein